MAQSDGADPAGVVVGRPDARPVAVLLFELERLALQGLRDLLGRVVGLGSHRRDLDRAEAERH